MRPVGLPAKRRFCSLILLASLVLTTVWMLPAAAQAQAEQENKPASAAETAPVPQSEDGPSSTRPSSLPAGSPSLQLGPGDLVEVTVYNVPEMATKTRISLGGDLYLPLIDYVHVAGLSLEEAQTVIEKRLLDGGFVKDPHVSLFVDQYSNQGVNVLGEVAKPGVYQVLGDQRLLDIISAAGGFTDKAGKVLTLTHRNDPNKPVTLQMPQKLGESPDTNVRILPGDTLVVHKADVVYVVGEVTRPSGFLMERGTMTVLQAVALAGGPTPTAKLNGVRIIRKGPGGMTQTDVELKKMLQAKTPDITLQADDILFVPTSQRKIIGRRGIEAAITAATAVTIYTVR